MNPGECNRSEYFLVAPAAVAFLGGEVKDSTVTLATMDPGGQGNLFFGQS